MASAGLKEERESILKEKAAATADNLFAFPPETVAAGLGRLGDWLAPLVLLISDYTAVIMAMATAYLFRLHVVPLFVPNLPEFNFSGSYLFFVLPFIYLVLFCYEQLYYRRLPQWQSTERLFKACFFATVLSVGIMYFSYTAKDISRTFVAASGGIAFVYLMVSRYFIKRLLVWSGLWQKPVILVGCGKTAELLAQAFAAEPNMGYRIVGLIEDECDRTLTHQYPLLGNLANIEAIIKASRVKEVIIAAPELEREKMLDLVYRVRPLVNQVAIVPDLFGVPMSNMEVETLFDQKTVMLRTRNNLASLSNRLLKYGLDWICCLLGLVLLIPVLLVLALLIYIDSPGPIIFAHRRVGVHGKSFPCFKFRTMVIDAQAKLEEYLASHPAVCEEWQRDFKLKDDPRVTRIGKWLRKTSLDELPQLFNILRGEMSLVGPRPIIAAEIEKYGEYIHDYYMVRPGLTGYWQVNGRNDVDYGDRVMMDSWYVRNWSVWLDLTLLVKTVKVVLRRTGAY